MSNLDPPLPTALSADVAAASALNDPVRLALYEYVIGQADLVSRDEAADAIGIRREMAAFHLDRLADEGLLDFEFRRLSGKQGPGAGRPAKLYRRSAREVHVSLPQRRYDVAAWLFAQALTEPGRSPTKALLATAREFGESLGLEARRRAGARAGRKRLLESAALTLREYGYEPRLRDDGGLSLQNCPFDVLSRNFPGVICEMNLALMNGLVTGLKARHVAAIFDPQPGRCCVILAKP